MICADRDIILLNKLYDSGSRRDTYVATRIAGVSVYETRQSTVGGGFHEASESYTIRIPISARFQDGKTYLPEWAFDELSDNDADQHWTIHREDLIVVADSPFADIDAPVVFPSESVAERDVLDFARSAGYQSDVIRVVSYVDATKWGTNRVKHWMIGGA